MTVGDRQDARLLPCETFLDQETSAGVAEFAVFGDSLDRVERFLFIVANDDALPGGEPVRFDDELRFAPGVNEVRRVANVVERLAARRRNERFVQHFFTENFASFKSRRFFVRPERLQALRFERVDQTGGKRRFRPDDRKGDLFFLRERDQRREVFFADRDVFRLRFRRRSGVPRRDVDSADFRTLR